MGPTLAVSLSLLALIEVLAFLGLRWALRADEHRSRARLLTIGYVLIAIGVWGPWLITRLFGNTGAPPAVLIVALVSSYLPKLVLAGLTLLELLRRLVTALIVRRRVPTAPPAPDWPTRTRLLPRVGLVCAALLLASSLWGATFGRFDVSLNLHEVTVDSLPGEFDGLRIVHLSDVHVASLGFSAARLSARLIAAVNSQRPDLVVYTGDYGTAAELGAGPDLLGQLRARLGKFAVLGNHDFGGQERAADNWASLDDKRQKIATLARAFRSKGFELLVNNAVTLSAGNARIALLGVGVHDSHHGFADADLSAAETAAGDTAFRVLLAHSPEYWEKFIQGRAPVDLTLVGHTHGAQVGIGLGPLKWSPAALEFRYWGGLYRVGRQLLNVNRGTGCVGLPFRINMPAEVSVIVLRARRPDSSS